MNSLCTCTAHTPVQQLLRLLLRLKKRLAVLLVAAGVLEHYRFPVKPWLFVVAQQGKGVSSTPGPFNLPTTDHLPVPHSPVYSKL